LERKLAGLSHHQSQLNSEWDLTAWIKEEAARTGKEAGLDAAEGFRRIILGD